MSEMEIECVKIYLTSSGKIYVYCNFCKSRLNNRNKLIQHIQEHFSSIPYECHLCDDKYHEFDKFIFHIKDEHKIQQKLNCDEEINDCNINNNHKNHLPATIRRDTGLDEYKIEPEIIYFNETDTHGYDFVIKDEITKDDRYLIDSDSEQKMEPNTTIEHDSGDNSEENDSMNSQVCNLDTVKIQDDKLHAYESKTKRKSAGKRKRYPPKNKFMCDICGKSYLQIRSLQEHLQSHIDPNERKCVCNICHKRFNSVGYLKVHLRFHNNERPYKCEFCPKQFVTNSTWRSHTRIHLNIKPYKCDVCNKQFREGNTLRDHKRIHTGEKPYKCDLCTLGFRKRDALRNHRRIHTGEKPYNCEICQKGFPSKAAVFGHMKSRHKNI